ncbi:hypothetical protein ACE1TH_16010 [Shouchella sp. JSM 1781072]|uniref:hypothetical protein n=1 Tax=Shouchella sp. JSM 1781072 TaxID=3344581 RepID=UPI0035BF7668
MKKLIMSTFLLIPLLGCQPEQEGADNEGNDGGKYNGQEEQQQQLIPENWEGQIGEVITLETGEFQLIGLNGESETIKDSPLLVTYERTNLIRGELTDILSVDSKDDDEIIEYIEISLYFINQSDEYLALSETDFTLSINNGEEDLGFNQAVTDPASTNVLDGYESNTSKTLGFVPETTDLEEIEQLTLSFSGARFGKVESIEELNDTEGANFTDGFDMDISI